MPHQPLPAASRPRSNTPPPERLRLLLRVHPERIAPRPLGRCARQAWLNLPLEYPEFSFERLTLDEHHVVLEVLGPPQRGSHPPIRGVLAHYKAMVTRLAGLGRTVWQPGCTVEPMAREWPGTFGARPTGMIGPAYLRVLAADREK